MHGYTYGWNQQQLVERVHIISLSNYIIYDEKDWQHKEREIESTSRAHSWSEKIFIGAVHMVDARKNIEDKLVQAGGRFVTVCNHKKTKNGKWDRKQLHYYFRSLNVGVVIVWIQQKDHASRVALYIRWWVPSWFNHWFINNTKLCDTNRVHVTESG